MGPSSCGKGYLTNEIIKPYCEKHGKRLVVISTGELLREEVANQTNLGKLAKTFIDKGILVPDRLIWSMFEKKLLSLGPNIPNLFIIIDGLPRNLFQLGALWHLIPQHFEDEKVEVIAINAEERILIERMLKRAEKEKRSDDYKESFYQKMDVYRKDVFPTVRKAADIIVWKNFHIIDANQDLKEIDHSSMLNQIFN